MASLNPDTRKVLLARFIHDCELAKPLEKPSKDKDHQEIKGEGTRAKSTATSPKANNPESHINPHSDRHLDKQGERGDSKDSSPEPDQTPLQGTTTNITQEHSVDAEPAVKATKSTDSSEVNNQEIDQEPHPRS
ncbi:uncharacterized protein MELLADRAFT_113072 [Melampsora larici-populina 98AG31]|uniref:Uncharacterized protein n=1 Tax=Melampsora larici-populina (strain 98AG31 / pathotype 3-4-7) TaxID=747676 RepID=F4S8I2_MELLP|nr:uncharacterized protein MELLADRAFT_113072 [Melampsora larici-populina 98AG31]EGF99025.1 hypothetical protein MELLADRAFT_113072 [Melampsora larici-populina 98AG31]